MPEPVVLTLLGTNCTARELGIENGTDDRHRVLAVLTKIQHGILGTYGLRAEFEVSEAELKAYCRQLIPAGKELGSKMDASNWFEKTWTKWQDGGERSGGRIMAASDIARGKSTRAFSRAAADACTGWRRALHSPSRRAGPIWRNARKRETSRFPMRRVRTEYWKRLREIKPRPAAEIDGAAALAQTPGEYRKQQRLESGRRGRVPPAPPP